MFEKIGLLSLKNQNVSKQLAKGGIIGVGAYFFLKPINFITSVILARYLGVEDFGLYSLGLSIIIVLNTFTNVGLGQGIVRFVSIYRSEQNYSKVKGIFFSSLAISLSVGILTAAIVGIFSNQLSQIFVQGESLGIVLIILSLGLPFNSIYIFIGAMSQAYKRIDYQNLIVNIARPLSYLLLILIFIFFNLNLTGITLANSLSTLVVVMIAVLLLLKIFPQIKESTIKPEYELKKLLAFSLPILVTGFTSMLLLRVDRIMIGYFSSETSVGIYNAAANAAINISFFLIPFVNIFAPMAAELYHQHKSEELKKAFQDVSRWLLVFTLPLFFVFVIFSNEILSVFGNEFQAGSTVLIVISLAQLINVFTGPVGVILKMSGHQNIDMFISFLVLITNILLNLILIPIYDMKGAAISTAISIALTNSLRMIMVYKFHKMWPFNIYTFKPLIIFSVVSLISIFFIESFAIELKLKIIIGIISLSIYFFSMFLFKLESTDLYILNVLKQKFLFFRRKNHKSNLKL